MILGMKYYFSSSPSNDIFLNFLTTGRQSLPLKLQGEENPITLEKNY